MFDYRPCRDTLRLFVDLPNLISSSESSSLLLFFFPLGEPLLMVKDGERDFSAFSLSLLARSR